MKRDERYFEKFLAWEASTRDTIDFKKIYVDMSGDLIAGLLLSQIVYWHLPKKNGDSKMKSIKRDGHYWIAKSYSRWYNEIRISQYQAMRAIEILVEKGLVEKRLYKFAGAPTIHIRIIMEGFLRAWDIAIDEYLEIGNEGNPQIQLRESPKSLIENNNKEEKMRTSAQVNKLPDENLRWLKAEYRDLGLAFLKYAGSEYNPVNKSEINLWYRELKIWKSIKINEDVIKAVIRDMRQSGLSIKSPVSITGMLRNYKSSNVSNEANVFNGDESELY
jgi:hypothetical protein